jgi:DNA-binding Lrp family transcriptional regulator
MILSEKELAELAVVELHADLPLAEIRKRTNQRSHTIRYNLKRLEERGVISKAPFIDVYPLGYTGHAIFFSIAPDSSSSKEAFLQSLEDHPNVQWLAELGGNYQYVATLFVRHPSEIQDFFDSINQKFGNILFEKTISTRLSFTQFNRKYFGGKPDSLSFGSTTPQTIAIWMRNIIWR